MLRFEVFTLFPEIFENYLQYSILQRAQSHALISVHLHNIRDWATDRHHITDAEPYGGGGGMVMKPEPIFAAVEAVLGSPPECSVILLTPQGRVFTQMVAMELAGISISSSLDAQPQTSHRNRIGLICGRYEGIDERVRQHLVTDEISIGDYVITGGELAALVVIDAITRLIPGALGDPDGAMDDSHASGLLEYPHYTRPPEFRGWRVPDVLISGDHGKIARWRREQALIRTWQRRPDLLKSVALSDHELKFIADLEAKDETGIDQEQN